MTGASGRVDSTADLQTGAESLFQIINYVGQFIAMSGQPALGLVISGLSGLAGNFLSHQMEGAKAFISDLRSVCSQLGVQIITDENQRYVLQTQQDMSDDGKGGKFNIDVKVQAIQKATTQADLKALQPDIDRINALLAMVLPRLNPDQTVTPELLLAVDGMEDMAPTKSSDLTKAPDCLLKSGAWFLYANYVLALGQSLLAAQQALYGNNKPGPDGKTTAKDIARHLGELSSRYLAYALQLQKVYLDQCHDRTTKLRLQKWTNTSGAIDFTLIVEIVDDYAAQMGRDSVLEQVHGNTLKSDEYGEAGTFKRANDLLGGVKNRAYSAYRDELESWFWDRPVESPSFSFICAITQMGMNDVNLRKSMATFGIQ